MHNLENIYRGLTYLNNNLDYIQKELYNNSKSVVNRDTKIMYFDCTNYYFDINEETEFQKYPTMRAASAIRNKWVEIYFSEEMFFENRILIEIQL